MLVLQGQPTLSVNVEGSPATLVTWCELLNPADAPSRIALH